MRVLSLVLFLFLNISTRGQLTFNPNNISPAILECAQRINTITKNTNFDYIDSTRKKYTDEIYMNMPYATTSELYELTNFPNKYVRLQAFTLLVEFKYQVDTVLNILEKNSIDTLESIEKLIGDVMDKKTVYEYMLEETRDWWKLQLKRNSYYLSTKQKLRFDSLVLRSKHDNL